MFPRALRRATAAVTAIALLGCGGGGAAPTSGPAEPTTGAPSTGTPPATPPTQTPTPAPVTPTPVPPAPPPAPSSLSISTANRSYSPTPVTIAANGTVTWNFVEERHNVTFLGAAPSGGSIPDTEEGNSASRTFSTPGTYQFECTRHRDKGMRGTIVVVSEAQPVPQPPATTPPPSQPPTSPAEAGSSVTVSTPSARFTPAAVTIAVGATVTWQFSEARHNVTFQGNAPATGNIPDADPGTSVSRTFNTAGTFDYLCTRHSGMSGRIIVQ